MDGDIEQDIIDYCVNEDKEVILFGQEDDCECDGENCDYHDVDTTSSATYKGNGKEVAEKEYYDKLANVEAKFQKHMGIVLNDYSDFINEMKNWKDLLSW